ncbi:hypothetical protein P3X46_000576 [Hevea brasiliensis]|uniref:Large ribosomal subunit protein uL24 C-terminal domain-containing protein n=1 Tax=Hevea brasiliensis TaxID=3981 RepID=A0ABQ9NCA6_HEVBR|nr:hypothetical protein P3X46_000576 [Hevea brasiliensis]
MRWKELERQCPHHAIPKWMINQNFYTNGKGETGVIKHIIHSQNRVIVEGKNLVKKHIKAGEGHEFGIFTVETPFHASNVQVLDPLTGRWSKVRVCRGQGASRSVISRPEILKIRTTPRPTVVNITVNPSICVKIGIGKPELQVAHFRLIPI